MSGDRLRWGYDISGITLMGGVASHKQPRIVFYDIETSLALLAKFDLYPEYTSHENIVDDWHIICACWKELGKKKVHSVSTLDDPKGSDYHVVKTLRETIANADIIVHHNGDKFDIKKLNARLIYHNLEPLPPVITIDTLKEAKRIAAFTSNRLDYLGQYFGLGGKKPTSKGLWLRVLRGDKEAVGEMVRYNKRDVTLLEAVYLRLRPFMKSHPNIKGGDCPKCGDGELIKRGRYSVRSGVTYQLLSCKKCGGFSRQKVALSGGPGVVNV